MAIQAFTNTGSHIWTVPAGVTEVEVLVVAGGGGGGKRHGGGGGAGGVVYDSAWEVSGDISINIGDGGDGAEDNSGNPIAATDGGNSSFGSLVALGGGAGGSFSSDFLAGHNGGSGGGSATSSTISFSSGGSATQPGSTSADVNAGNDGGDADQLGSPWIGSGGGGASQNGEDPDYGSDSGGDGGDGLYYGNIFGDAYGENGYFAGGGGGASDGGTPGAGGIGGASDGTDGDIEPSDATPNTGGGGGGARSSYSGATIHGGDGGSGIVLIKYTIPPEPITNYNKTKSIKVATEAGTPTISKTQCLKITSGDDSTTGTGEIVLDWTNISSKSDIGVYDENDTLLDYYFESFDTGNSTAVIWVYRAWEQDDTVQAKIAYGDGPSDQSVGASTVFDKESDLSLGYLLSESSGDAIDVTSNNNDGTVNSSPYGGTGIVDGAYDFDGNDDYIDSNYVLSGDDFTIAFWAKTPSVNNEKTFFRERPTGDDSIYFRINIDGTVDFRNKRNTNQIVLTDDPNSYDDDTWHHFVFTSIRNGTAYLYIDGSNVDSDSVSDNPLNFGSQNLIIGRDHNNNDEYYPGILDDIRVYGGVALSSDEISALYAATKSSPDFFSQEDALITLTGQITLNEVGVSATVMGYNETTDTFLGYSATDGSGNYTFTEAGFPGDIILVAAQHDGTEKYGRVKTIELS